MNPQAFFGIMSASAAAQQPQSGEKRERPSVIDMRHTIHAMGLGPKPIGPLPDGLALPNRRNSVVITAGDAAGGGGESAHAAPSSDVRV